ncbi:MAG TPA: hypothetical protein V6D29_17655 [Leptolyngbyaceae cyanobacterium]
MVGGWWMAALASIWPLWLGTGGVTLYLVMVGTGAIALSNAWVLLLIATAIFKGNYPIFWPSNQPYQYWATLLLILWSVGVTVVFLLGLQSQRLKQFRNQKRRTYQLALLLLTWAALCLGYLTYRLGILA